MTASASRTRKRLIALTVSSAAALLLAELAVRVTLGAPLVERMPLMKMRASAQRGWEMVPGQVHYTYQERVAVNSLGLRGRELGEKRAGERRVLYLGDSLVYGQGVGDEDTQPSQLERALRERDPNQDWSVINAGHRSYGTAQELALLAELGARIRPDVVLLGWYWNDIDEHDVAKTYARLKDRGELYFDTGNRLEGSDLVAWRAKQLLRRSAVVMLLHDLMAPGMKPYPPDYLAKVWERTGHELERLRTLCAGLGARPVLVVIPDARRIGGGGMTRAFDERVAELARGAGVPVIELLPALAALHDRTHALPVLPFDGHYDAAGNRAMAEHLAEGLLALGLVRSG
jgi:lysophospholipase L1-like esterase